ncbi:alpha/beta hydrolase [Varibaculum massiliense]|uniref:alpha/beta hydrolase n=1 Tax=Varibaculum massiliense TaxID=1852372 RepID=UPI0009F4955C|nr:alpha/beta hydrolase [Varibaculum massiliense]
MMVKRKLFTLLATTFALCLTLSACGVPIKPHSKLAPSASSRTNSLAGEDAAIPAGLESYYQQKISWVPCAEDELKDYQCGQVKVPLDYADPKKEDIELALARSQASGKKLGSLLINPGGPGGSGVDLLGNSADMFSDQVFSAFDVVGFDPRGVSRSHPIECTTDAQKDESLAESLDLGTAAGRERSIADMKEFAQRCQEKSGDLARYLDTVSTARDLDILRAVLGDKKLSYLGYSYGSFLGITYAQLFPKNVGRLVLDGILDGSYSFGQVSLAQAKGFEEAFGNFASWCVREGKNCPWKTKETGLKHLKEFFAAADASPIPTEDASRPLNGALAFGAAIGMLYYETLYPSLLEGLQAAFKGDGTPLLQVSDLFNDRGSDGKFKDNSQDAFMAINGADYPVQGDKKEWDQRGKKILRDFPIMGSSMAYGEYALQEWPWPSAAKREKVKIEGAQPILLLGNTGDPATPYEMARSVHKQIPNSRLLTWKSYSHTAYGLGSDCVQDTVDKYLVGGVLPDSDVTCND